MDNKLLVSNIESVIRDYCGRECLLLPSGRMALYLAFRKLLKPGDRLLMSPVNDDVIFFTVLAAGLQPVMAPVTRWDGNIDVDAIPEAVWSSIDAVMTTNLYGLPDRLPQLRALCDKYKLVMIEDAAHAFTVSLDERPVGTFGHCGAFSFSKHLNQAGGALCLEDAAQKEEFLSLSRELIKQRSLSVKTQDFVKPPASWVLQSLGLKRIMKKARNILLGSPEPDRIGHRMPLRTAELRHAMAAGAGLDAFDSWVRVDASRYRLELTGKELEALYTSLTGRHADTTRRLRGVTSLRELPFIAPGIVNTPVRPYLRVPLLISDREAVRDRLIRSGLRVIYIYDPPLDDYAGTEFTRTVAPSQNARWWAGHVLPVNPLEAESFLHLINTGEVRLEAPDSPSADREPVPAISSRTLAELPL
jgi:hypothetical protein